MKKYVLGSLFVLAISLLFGCGGDEYISKKADKPIIIDGNDNDWEGKATYMKDQGVILGVQNDADNLYLMLVTSNQSKIHQILSRGLIIWFDGEGGSSKKFGIKYPFGHIPGDMQGKDFKKGDFGREAPPPNLERMSNELEVFEPDTKTWARTTFVETKGIEAKISYKNDRLVYELRIALSPKGGNSYFIPTGKDKIGVGFEVPEFDRSKIKERPSGDGEMGGPEGGPGGGFGGGERAGGGMEGGGGRGPGGHGGGRGPGGAGGESQKSFSYWTTVTLAP